MSSPAAVGASTVAAAPSSVVHLRKRGIVAMILFAIVSNGLYVPIWFLRRRSALNQLQSDRKLRAYPFVGILALLLILLTMSFIAGFTRQAPSSNVFASVVQLTVTIALVVQAFFVKDILEDHLIEKLKPEPTLGTGVGDSCKLSGLLTFFLGIFYLQYVINTRMA